MKSNIFLLFIIIFFSFFTSCQKDSLEYMGVLTNETTELTTTADLFENQHDKHEMLVAHKWHKEPS